MANFQNFLFLAAAFLLPGCYGWDVEAPENTNSGQVIQMAEPADLAIRVAASTKSIESEITQNVIGEPIFKGRTDEISAELLVDKSFPEELEKYLISPFKAAGCTTIGEQVKCIRKVTKRILKSCKPWDPPWKCFEDVLEDEWYDCTKPVQSCWDEQQEVWGTRVKIAAHVKEILQPTSVWLNYEGWVRDVSVQAGPDLLVVAANLRANVSADIREGVLGASMTVKGALKCETDFSVRAHLDVSIADGGVVDIDVADVTFGVDQLCLPGAIEGVEIASILNPHQLIANEKLAEVLREPLLKVINDQVDEQLADDLDFSDSIQALVRDMSKPIVIDESVNVLIQPEYLVVNQPFGRGSGRENELVIPVSLHARPHVVTGELPKVDIPDEIPLNTDRPVADEFVLSMTGTIDLSQVEGVIEKELKAYVASNYPDIRYAIEHVSVYQSGSKFVIGVHAQDAKRGKPAGSVYVWASPKLDLDTKELYFEDLGLDIKSKNAIAKFADLAFFDTVFELIEGRVRFSFGDELAKLLDEVEEIEIRNDRDGFSLHGKVTSIEPGAIWVFDKAIHLTAIAIGTARVEVR